MVIRRFYNWIKDNCQALGVDGAFVCLLIIAAFANVYAAGGATLLAVLYILAGRARRDRILRAPHVRWLWPFFVLLVAVPLFYSNWLGAAVGLAVPAFFVIYLYFSSVMTKPLFERILDLACLMSIACAVLALTLRLTGVNPRSTSTFHNANYYGYATELLLLIAFYRLFSARTKGGKAFFALTVLLNTAAMWASDCRSAWLSVLGGLVLLFMLEKHYKTLLALIVVYASGVVLAFTFPDIFPRLDHLEFAKDIRTGIWLDALGGIRQHPLFGTGPLTFVAISGGKYMHSHNMVLETLLSCGAVGLLSVGGYFVLSARDAVRAFVAGEQQNTLSLVFAVGMATLIHGITDFTALWPQTGLLLFLALSGQGLLNRRAASSLFFPRQDKKKPVEKSA